MESRFNQCGEALSSGGSEPEARAGVRPMLRGMARPKNQTARRGQLNAAARRVIAARGIEAVRIKDVADEAGMSPQSVLYYYPDIDQLIEEAIQHVVERFAERRRETAEGIDDPRAALVGMIRAGLPSGPD